MNYTKIDMNSYPRREHFERFNSYGNPYGGITAEVDITDALARIHAEKRPFFITMLYFMTKAANQVPEFRQRILDGEIISFECCSGSYTCAKGDGTYCHVPSYYQDDLDAFTEDTKEHQRIALEHATVAEEDDCLSRYFFSSTPWISFLDVQQPTPVPADSNPRIVFGKYREVGGRVVMPVNIFINHALCDGWHIAQVFFNFEKYLAEFAKA